MVPAQLPEHPAPLRDAASVILLREREQVLEVFLLRRVSGMAFAGGMSVFPGGGVDERDSEASIAWAGPGPAWWAEQFDCSQTLASALVCAAVRETFEESGVLLAGEDERSVVADTAGFAAQRRALVDRELSLAGFLDEAGLVLRADLLRPWANWLTPEAEPRRYDARFFVAEVPLGQRADGATTEADNVAWQSPEQALQDWREGRRGLLPPTWVSLAELAAQVSLAAVLAAQRTVTPIMPKV
ncbi:MAG: NUDIX hydrolase, partial [Sciscionella sp.]